MNIIHKILTKIFGSTKDMVEIHEAKVKRIKENSELWLKIVLRAKEEGRELTEHEKFALDILRLEDATL